MTTLLELTVDFYTVISSLFNWFFEELEIFGLEFSFAPIDIIFNWVTLGAILLLVIAKALVPLL